MHYVYLVLEACCLASLQDSSQSSEDTEEPVDQTDSLEMVGGTRAHMGGFVWMCVHAYTCGAVVTDRPYTSYPSSTLQSTKSVALGDRENLQLTRPECASKSQKMKRQHYGTKSLQHTSLTPQQQSRIPKKQPLQPVN